MVGLWLICTGIILFSTSGLAGCCFSSHSVFSQRVTTAFMLLGSICGLMGIVLALGQPTARLELYWSLPWGRSGVALDALGAVFLLLVFSIPTLGSIYGLGYWQQHEHLENGQRLGVFYGLLAGSMALVIIACDGILFLIAWEIMAMAAYFAATVEEDNPEVRRAGWVYLVATHTGTLALLALFALWHQATGSFTLAGYISGLPAQTANILFVLALVGFGFKAGLMPLHLWLPGAHANAPSHVSAVMSGVMLKMGIYGILRITSLLPVTSLWWGGGLIGLGAISGLVGIIFALSQYDLKRLLAYSSIENIGIIAMGIGLALLGRGLGRWDLVLLGLAGSLLHVWNHGLFKPLLFMSAGAIIHSTGTRNIDQLGGLARQMPRLMVLFLLGAIAICALPPLNGFVSEWLLYIGFFRTLGLEADSGIMAISTAAVALAMIGALAVTVFIKLFGAVFLGTARSTEAIHAHDPKASMIVPMVVLALGCLALGFFPIPVFPLLERAVRIWGISPEVQATITAIVPMRWITGAGLGLVGLAAMLAGCLKLVVRAKRIDRQGTWDCGYARPTTRMQYNGSSFGATLVGLFAFLLHPQEHRPVLRNLFPGIGQFKLLVPDVVLERLVLPCFNFAGRYLPRIRVLQQGQTHWYLLYILIITIVLLVFWGVGVSS